MEKKRMPGWRYFYSQELKQEIALSLKTGWVFCEDGTKYSPTEIDLIAGEYISHSAHLAKKIFEGELVNEKSDQNRGKPAQGRITYNSGNNKADSQKIQRNTGYLPQAADQQLEIF